MQYIYSLSLSAVVVKVNLTWLWLFKNSEEFYQKNKTIKDLASVY